MADPVAEELRDLKKMHAELMGKISDLCVAMERVTARLDHTQKDYDVLQGELDKLSDDVYQLKIESAGNSYILDIAKGMNRQMWVMICSAIAAVALSNVDLSKVFGG